jgi:2,3-bisphosphoglycerate-independent phosphoglycerate mutase
MTKLKSISKRALLVICDGMGFSDNETKNAVKDANTPILDQLIKDFPYTLIQPGGELVGLPKGVAGNSEVGHMNIGAGRPVRQDLVRINEAIEQNTFKDLPRFKDLLENSKKSKRIHLMGLLSDGGVHSHINHLKAIIKYINEADASIKIFLHAFSDGRDTSKTTGINYIKEINQVAGFTFASLGGRSIGMDRDRRWEKIQHHYDVMTGKGKTSELSPEEYILSQYDQDLYDEFIEPVLFTQEGAIRNEDSVFFFNFRPDRAKQISLAFCNPNFEHFDNSIRPNFYLCMSPYIDEELPQVPILFDREKVKGTIIEFLSKQNVKTFKIAETEKYAHVTYFFNGGEEKPFPLEERVLIDSPKEVKTYDEKPEMSTFLVLEELKKALTDKSFGLYVVNFANPDMVGHTGNYQAAVKAMEAVDKCLGELLTIVNQTDDLTMCITADHGNCDQMVYPDGSPHTSHSGAKVPFIIVNPQLKQQKLAQNSEEFALKDISPTLLNILGYNLPKEFEGHSIFN